MRQAGRARCPRARRGGRGGAGALHRGRTARPSGLAAAADSEARAYRVTQPVAPPFPRGWWTHTLTLSLTLRYSQAAPDRNSPEVRARVTLTTDSSRRREERAPDACDHPAASDARTEGRSQDVPCDSLCANLRESRNWRAVAESGLWSPGAEMGRGADGEGTSRGRRGGSAPRLWW